MALTAELAEKYARLRGILAGLDGAAVAFSGGVDSSFLCYAAHDALGGRAIAVTVVSPMLPRSEREEARAVAAKIGIEHVLVEETEIDRDVAENPKERCYFCKKLEFGHIQEAARARGAGTVLDGSNMDDLGDYRPGLKALAELRVMSPLREAGLAKEEIRALSKEFGLPTWDKPAFACLASRIPYGERIDAAKLARIERAEDFLRAEGFRQFRVRSHGDIARVEVAPEERSRFFDAAFMDRAGAEMRAAGFLYAALELEGYRTGNLNRALGQPEPAGQGTR